MLVCYHQIAYLKVIVFSVARGLLARRTSGSIVFQNDKNCFEKFQRLTTRMTEGPRKVAREDILTHLDLFSLECRHASEDAIEAFNKAKVRSGIRPETSFLDYSDPRTRGNGMKPIKHRFRVTAREYFSRNRVANGRIMLFRCTMQAHAIKLF